MKILQSTVLIAKFVTLQIFLFPQLFSFGQNMDSIPSVVIGKQTWSTKSLVVTKFANGDEISIAKTKKEAEDIMRSKKPYCASYNFDSTNDSIYGKYYNWAAVNDPRGLAPIGWRIPKNEDFEELRIHTFTIINDASMSGKPLKSKTNWKGNKGNNKTGFNAKPGGVLSSFGFAYDKQLSFFWSSSPKIKDRNPYQFVLSNKNHGTTLFSQWSEECAMSVRCLKK